MKDNRIPTELTESEINTYFNSIFNSNCKSDYFRKITNLNWHLPVIIESKKTVPFNLNSDNLLDGILGLYFTETGWKTEGTIVLYTDNIRSASILLAESLKMDKESAYKGLLKIVFLHELGHWISHWKISSLNKEKIKSHYNENFKSQSDELLEGIAQYYVWLAIQKDEELLALFNELLKGQHPVYHGHKTLIKSHQPGKEFIETMIENYDEIKGLLSDKNIINPTLIDETLQDELIELKNEKKLNVEWNILKPFLSEKNWKEKVVDIGLGNLGF